MENTVFSPELAEKCSLCALKRRTTFHLEQAYDHDERARRAARPTDRTDVWTDYPSNVRITVMTVMICWKPDEKQEEEKADQGKKEGG
jgi:hypothetical protein